MIHAPTPAQFLTQVEPDETDEAPIGMYLAPGERPLSDFMRQDPLESIAESLRTLASSHGPVELAPLLTAETSCATCTDSAEQLADAHQYLDDAEAKARAAFELIEEVEAIIKPSTSKLANSVRAAIASWRGVPEPEAPADEVPQEDPTADEAAGPVVVEQLPGQPAPEAGLEEWRDFALRRGVPDAVSLNRSQIRTVLGLPHFES